MVKKSYIEAEILQKTPLSDRVMEFTINSVELFEFTPGQYVKLKLEIENKSKSADYTIVSSNTLKNQLKVAIDNHPKSKVGKNIQLLAVGDSIEIKGPYGKFKSNLQSPSLNFIAKNIGLVSSIGNLQYLKDNHYEGNVMLNFIISDKFEPIYITEIQNFKKFLKLEYQIITMGNYPKSLISKGKMKKKIAKKLVNLDGDGEYYISGSSKFVRGMKKSLEKLEVQNTINTEKFG